MLTRTLFFAAMILIPTTAAQAADPVNPTAAEASVRTVISSHAAAIERGDLQALDKLYSDEPSVLIIEGTSVDVGWKRYRDHHLAPELKAIKNLKYRYNNISVTVAGDVAWASYDYTLDGVMKDKPLAIIGKGTLVLRKTGDAWKIVHSHTSGRPAGKPAAH
jgi:ketosteroid isomerase-like protein